MATNMKQKPEMQTVKTFRITCMECGRSEQIEEATAAKARQKALKTGWILAANGVQWLCDDDARNSYVKKAKMLLEARNRNHSILLEKMADVKRLKKIIRQLEKEARKLLDIAEYQGDDISFEFTDDEEAEELDETEEENEL